MRTTLLTYIAFFSLGLPDGLLGVAWPTLRGEYKLCLDSIGWILSCGVVGYMLSSFFYGKLVSMMGVGYLLAWSAVFTSAALFSISFSESYWQVVLASGIGGLGAGAIDSALNGYVAGKEDERLMHWMHAAFGVGIALSPALMTICIRYLGSWRLGYLLVGSFQAFEALLMFKNSSIWANCKQHSEEQALSTSLRFHLLRKDVLLSALMFFLYTGVELGLGLWMYSILIEVKGFSEGSSGLLTSSYWGAFTLGRIGAGFLSNRIPNHKQLLGALFLGVLFLFIFACSSNGFLVIVGAAGCGLAFAPIFPSLISSTKKRVASESYHTAIGVQIAAAGTGVAIVPTLGGMIAKLVGLGMIPLLFIVCLFLLLVCYLYSMKIVGECS